MKLKKNYTGKIWKEEEIIYLKELVETTTNKKLAIIFNLFKKSPPFREG